MRNLFTAFFLLLVSTARVLANDELPELKIHKLTEDVYIHTSYKVVEGFGLVDSNGLIVVLDKGAWIIDTPWSAADTERLLQWIEKRGLVAKGSVSTHFHEDRTAGIEYLNSRAIPTHASKLTNALLKEAARPQAANAFDNATSWLVKDQIEIFYPGPGHTQDNVVVWLPTQKTLFGGCFVRAKEAHGLGNVSDAFVSEWPKSAAKLASRYKKAKLVVPGHGHVGDASLVDHTQSLAAQASKAPSRTPAD